MTNLGVLSAGGFLLAGVVNLWIAAKARGNEDVPGGRAFAVFAIGTALVTGVLAALTVVGVSERLFAAAFFSLLFWLPVVWGAFAFEYTGSGLTGHRRQALLLAAPVIGTIGEGYLEVTRVETPQGPIEGLAAIGVIIALAQALSLLLVGAGALLKTTIDSDNHSPVLGAGLSVGGILPWFGFLVSGPVVSTLGHQSAVLAALFLGAAVVQAWIVSRFDPFSVVPGAGTVGPATVVEEMDAPVLVLDHNDQVTELNPAARDAIDRTHPYGEHVEDVLGVTLTDLRERDTVKIHTTDGRRDFESNVSRIADSEHPYGHTVVLHDVTDRLTRQQRLEVLNRILRHNLRNDVTAITGYSQTIARRSDEVEDLANRITKTARDLVDFGERAREVETMMARDPDPGPNYHTDVVEVVRSVVESVAADYPDRRFVTDVPDDAVRIAASKEILEPVVRNLVENAAEHNDGDEPTVNIAVETDAHSAYPVTVTVEDDGPGIPEQERRAVLDSVETDLRHGSGLGLWVVAWGIRRLGGTVTFSEAEPRGTVVTVSLPRTAEAEPAEPAAPDSVESTG